MQGIFVDFNRPASKKAIREAATADPSRVQIEATSVFGNDYDGSAADLPVGKKVLFVGPDPYTKRNFYGSIERASDGRVTVK